MGKKKEIVINSLNAKLEESLELEALAERVEFLALSSTLTAATIERCDDLHCDDFHNVADGGCDGDKPVCDYACDGFHESTNVCDDYSCPKDR